MFKKQLSILHLPTKLLRVIPSAPSIHEEGHDEWRLDEALAESFPASDSIAVTPIYPLRVGSTHVKPKVEGSSEISNCNIGHLDDIERGALNTPIECTLCHTTIPATAALSFEGADYIYQFCGPLCLKAWCTAAGAHDA